MDKIVKRASGWKLAPNMMKYTEDYYTFSWDQIRQSFSGLPDGGGLNIAHEAIDRHANGGRANQLAIRCLTQHGQAQDYTYTDIQRLSNRFANVLQDLGVRAGEGVFTLLGRTPELYVTAFGTLKNRSVFCPLFSTFGPEPISARLAIGKARVLVTTETLYLRKVKPLRASLPDLKFVLIVGSEGSTQKLEDTLDFHSLMAAAVDHFTIGPTDPETIALLHFTSGTTGRPKGAIHVHDALICHYATGKLALDIHPADVFWCTADPGWVTGTSYGIIAPLVIGADNDCRHRGI